MLDFSHIKMRLANKGKGLFKASANVIWLYDAIAGSEDEAYWMGGVSPSDFISQLGSMDGDVVIRINSPGGSVFGAQAMVAAIRQHKGKVTAQVDSIAASAASVIAVNCAECIMVRGSMMMIHKAWGMAIGNEADMRQTAELLDKIDGTIADSYARKTGMTSDKALNLMAAETWMTDQEAVDAGFANSVMGVDDQSIQSRWDLSAFAKAPKIVAENTAYNEADVSFANSMISTHGQAIADAKDVLSMGTDEAIAGIAGEVIGDATECIAELNEWLGAKGIGNNQAPEDKIDTDRAMRVRMASAALMYSPI